MKTRITELLNIDYPIFQGGMAWVADGDLAGAVSKAGGLGIIGGGNAPKEVVKANIDKIKSLTDKPFGVNIMLLCAIFAAVSIMMFTDNMPDIMLFIFIALGVYMNYAYTFGMDRRARKLFRQTKVAQDIVNEYDFFDEYFSYRNTNGQGTMAYDKLFKVIETRTHFYLMLSKVQGYTIAKAEAPANFTEFMQKKIEEYNLKA